MPYVRESILAALETQLETVTLGNGYENTVTGCTRYPIRQDGDVENMEHSPPQFYLFDGVETNILEKSESNSELWFLDCAVVGIAESDTDPSTKMNSLLGDLKKLIASDRCFQAKVHDTRITAVTPLSDLTKPHAGFEAGVTIRYQTDDTTP